MGIHGTTSSFKYFLAGLLDFKADYWVHPILITFVIESYLHVVCDLLSRFVRAFVSWT